MRRREQEPRISSPAADRPEVDMPFSACPISAGALSAHSQTAVYEYVPPVYSGRSAPVYPPQILRFHSACAGAACHMGRRAAVPVPWRSVRRVRRRLSTRRSVPLKKLLVLLHFCGIIAVSSPSVDDGAAWAAIVFTPLRL